MIMNRLKTRIAVSVNTITAQLPEQQIKGSNISLEIIILIKTVKMNTLVTRIIIIMNFQVGSTGHVIFAFSHASAYWQCVF